MRTIVTKIIHSPTKASKVKAISEKCFAVVSRGDDDYTKAHKRAVLALFEKYGWTKQRMYGNELGNNIVWVPVNKKLKI